MKIVKKRTQKWLKMKSECIFWRFSVLGQILEDKSDQKKTGTGLKQKMQENEPM